jgi:predicted phage terminase large subunit-like protein
MSGGAGLTREQRSFREWSAKANKQFHWFKHCEVLGNVLQRVADGELRRVMIFEPPRHGKSLQTSRMFSAYYLSRFPSKWVTVASYGAELALDMTRAAKEYYLEGGGELRADQRAAGNWSTLAGGGMRSAGAGGPLTGRGFDLGIIDDPVKNAEEAASETIRRRHQEWWQSTFRTRAEPDSAIVIIQTRWHTDDLSGWLLGREGSEATEGWHVVNLPAIAEEPPEIPATCTLEPDWREMGQPLCPERYDLPALSALRGGTGPYYWAAMFQQRPAPRGGGMFERAWFEVIGGTPSPVTARVRYWDKAGTAGGDGARTAGVLMARCGNTFVIEDVVAGRWGATEREKVILQTAQADKVTYGRVETWVEQEPGSGGKESAEATVRMLSLVGLTAQAEAVRGDKALRAEPLAGAASVGNVKLRGVATETAWVEGFLAEAELFPMGALKDQVDAASGAYNKLIANQELIPLTAAALGLGGAAKGWNPLGVGAKR